MCGGRLNPGAARVASGYRGGGFSAYFVRGSFTVPRIPQRFGDDKRQARSQLATLLSDYRVAPLLSPLYFPRYNGSIEAGIGALETRVQPAELFE